MKHVINILATKERSANQLEKVLPIVLGHESEEGQEGPAKRVKTGVAKVGVPSSLHACVSLWALPINRETACYNCHQIAQNTDNKFSFPLNIRGIQDRSDKISMLVSVWIIRTQHQSCFHKVKHLHCLPNNSDSLQPNKKCNKSFPLTTSSAKHKRCNIR